MKGFKSCNCTTKMMGIPYRTLKPMLRNCLSLRTSSKKS